MFFTIQEDSSTCQILQDFTLALKAYLKELCSAKDALVCLGSYLGNDVNHGSIVDKRLGPC